MYNALNGCDSVNIKKSRQRGTTKDKALRFRGDSMRISPYTTKTSFTFVVTDIFTQHKHGSTLTLTLSSPLSIPSSLTRATFAPPFPSRKSLSAQTPYPHHICPRHKLHLDTCTFKSRGGHTGRGGICAVPEGATAAYDAD